MRSLPPYLNAAIHVLGVFFTLINFFKTLRDVTPKTPEEPNPSKAGKTKSDVDLHFRSSSP
ncbi:MAG: hypothetical protein RXO22_01295 [Thermocladium sp.]